jgi:hypothetical protein
MGDHTDNLSSSSLNGIRHSSHQADRCASVDQADSALGQKGAQLGGDGKICGITPGAGAAKDAETVHAV